jgi:uncharacterized membrane protein
MVDVITSIEINAPLKKVRDYACDPDTAPNWYVNIKSVRWQTPKPVQVGSRISFVAKFLGRELAYTYEVVEYSGFRFIMKTSEGPFPMETIYTFEKKSEDLTLMILRNKGKPSGFSKIFSPFMMLMMKRANKKDLQKIKAILENS